jgi:hypothetical protein
MHQQTQSMYISVAVVLVMLLLMRASSLDIAAQFMYAYIRKAKYNMQALVQ